MNPKSSVGDFQSPEDFRKSVETMIHRQAGNTGYDLQRLRREVAFERLLARLFADKSSPWVLKGGCAMELRIHGARSTKDIDLVVPQNEWALDTIREQLVTAASRDLGDFFFYQIRKARSLLQGPLEGGARYPVKCQVGDRSYVDFYVDIALGEPVLLPLDTVLVKGKLRWYHLAPVECRVICREQQFAEKIHAYVAARAIVGNSRVKDLIDLYLLIQEGQMTSDRIGVALHHVFKQRGTPSIPEGLLPPPEDWQARFDVVAASSDVQCSLDEAYQKVADYYSGSVALN